MSKKEAKNNKNKLLLPLIAACVLLAALALLVIPQGGGTTAIGGKTAAQAANQPLAIPLSSITETASFYPVSVEGTEMEVLAIRTAAGEIRTAFNICQSCYTSGHGYYSADGTELICQNCGSHFTAEQVGLEGHGGCHPWPIPAGQREETESEIVIPYETLVAGKTAFASWKKF